MFLIINLQVQIYE